jgi:hypothetical protein
VLCDIATQLGYLDFSLEFPLEAGEKDFPLARLETITETRDRSGAI